MATRKQTPQTQYQQWTIIPPPATRLYQLSDGNIGLYFDKARAWEMVVWAQGLVETFEALASMAEAQGIEQEEEEEEKEEQPKPNPPVVNQGVPPGLPIGMHKTPPNSIGAVRTQAELMSGLSVQKKNPMAVQRQQTVSQVESNQSPHDAAKLKYYEMRQVKADAAKFDMKNDPGYKIALAQSAKLPQTVRKHSPKKESEIPPTISSEIPDSPRPTDDLPNVGFEPSEPVNKQEGTEPSVKNDPEDIEGL